MTIDQHFVMMILLEFGIFFLGIWVVKRGQDKQTALIEMIVYNPDYAAAVAANMAAGLLKKIETDKELQTAVFEFMRAGAIAAYTTIIQWGTEHKEEIIDSARAAIAKRTKVKLPRGHMLKPVEGIINEFLPAELQKMHEGNQAAKKVKEGVEEGLAFVDE